MTASASQVTGLGSLQREHQDRVSSPSQISSKTFSKQLIQDKKSLEDLVAEIDITSFFAWDTETNGTFDPFKIELVGISFALNNHAAYVPINHLEGPDQLPMDYVIETLKPVMESEHIEKVCHNVKFDESVIERYGIKMAGKAHDTVVMAWLLQEDQEVKKLEVLVDKYFDVEIESYEEVVSRAPKPKNKDRDYNFARVSLEEAVDYACDDSYWCWRLHNLFMPQLDKEKLRQAYEHVERPFARTIKNVERHGVTVDIKAIDYANKKLPEIVEKVESDIYEEAGEVFNVGSGPQLGKILFEKLKIGKNVPKTKSGRYSTDKKTLELYSRHKVVENVLRRKKVSKTHSTFVEGMSKHIRRDGKIHTSFNGCGTVTGRLSSRDPNLQNIEGDEVEEIKVRDFFVPSEGNKFIVADYQQVEYRLMAHFSKDPTMINAFLSGHDFHEETARKAFDIPPDQEVAHRQRFIAKTINFGIGYGRGPFSLAETLECSMGEAKDYIDDYFKTFAQLSAYKDELVSGARKRGYLRTLTGRKRRLPELRSDNWKLRGHAERQAFNTKIQGSAADIIKLAMISLEPVLDHYDAHMCIQIHDELVIEAPDDRNINRCLKAVEHTMQNPVKGRNPLRVPLEVDPKIVEHWGDAK